MWNKKLFAFSLLLSCQIFSPLLSEEETQVQNPQITATEAPFRTFTGKINGEKVRMRLQAALESSVVKEYQKDDLVLVTGEKENFYEVAPHEGFKLFVFRTFVLEDTVEGNHVNIRLQPSLEAPVIGQLNTGDKVRGVVNEGSSKWLAIDPPEDTRFYIAKDFISEAGDAQFLSQMAKREKEVKHLLSSAYLTSQAELKKHFDEIDFEKMTENFQKVIQDYSDFPEKVQKAQAAIQLIQDSYLNKKIVFLESQAVASNWRQKNSDLSHKIESYQKQLSDLEKQLDHARSELHSPTPNQTTQSTPPLPEANTILAQELIQAFENTQSSEDISERMKIWNQIESARFHLWAMSNDDKTLDDFLNEEKEHSTDLSGVIEPYYSPVKNKPGDHFLRNESGAPIAYIYSTKVDLEKKVGHRVSLKATQRPNNFFAYPAYHVWSVE